MTGINRQERAVIALHDYGTRPGATAKSVRDAMLKDGFTLEEIADAARVLNGG